jgi:outer membrane protein assembly factor BamB
MKVWIASTVLVAFAASGFAADKPLAWPRFRGLNGSGVADGQKPPVEFGPDKNVKWKIAVPSGFSSPIVAGDELVITAFDRGKLYTIAYDRKSGNELWRAEAPAKQIEAYHPTEGSPAASTPATDGLRIVSYFGSCGLFCYDLSGKEQWHFEMPTALTANDFGTGVSPIIADGVVVLLRDQKKDPKIVAIDLKTGSLRWEMKRQGPCSSFCTPTIWDTPAGKQIVAPGYGRMIGYDLETGQENWSVTGMPSACCASPVVVDGTLFFAAWSPGDDSDKDFKMPSFDDLLKQGDANRDGSISREESEKTFLKGFFNNNDTNHDGMLTREEWDANMKFISQSKNSAFALRSGGTGDITATHMLWKKTRGLPYVPSGIVYRGQFLMVKDGGLITAYDAKTGNEVYVQKRALPSGRYYASPVAANGHVYFTSLDDGEVTVLKAATATPQIVAKNPKLGERVAATPAIADDTLYIRTQSHLYAFAEIK